MCYLYSLHDCTQTVTWFTCVQHQPRIQAEVGRGVLSSLSGRLSRWMQSLETSNPLIIPSVPGGEVNILGAHIV
jgi:hypothetical protein